MSKARCIQCGQNTSNTESVQKQADGLLYARVRISCPCGYHYQTEICHTAALARAYEEEAGAIEKGQSTPMTEERLRRFRGLEN